MKKLNNREKKELLLMAKTLLPNSYTMNLHDKIEPETIQRMIEEYKNSFTVLDLININELYQAYVKSGLEFKKFVEVYEIDFWRSSSLCIEIKQRNVFEQIISKHPELLEE